MFGEQMARLSMATGMARRPLLALEIGATWHKSVSGDLRWIRVVRALVHSHLKVTGRLAPVLCMMFTTPAEDVFAKLLERRNESAGVGSLT